MPPLSVIVFVVNPCIQIAHRQVGSIAWVPGHIVLGKYLLQVGIHSLAVGAQALLALNIRCLWQMLLSSSTDVANSRIIVGNRPNSASSNYATPIYVSREPLHQDKSDAYKASMWLIS